ncbi:MAG: EAL domain-containing protein [Acutalibacteraceae bacterium]|nr:EAL domain-containing protein [Acutalibacteraceae bacterium]
MSNKIGNFFKNNYIREKTHLSERKLLRNIKKGFDNQEFKMYLQFIVDSKDNKIASAETLSRWENASGEVVFPGTYIGIMEKSGLITRFDYYMFEKVCQKLSQWKDSKLCDVSLSCNLTRITISEKGFADKIKNIANKYDFDRSKLIIEITEDSLENNLVIAMFNIIEIKKLGFRIALDDIGSGYTSLVSLCEYPIDVVKIDREILLLARTEKGKKLLMGIVSLAHYLNLKVVCEGVETDEQNKLVTNSNCDYIQGWYYSKALSETMAEKFAIDYINKAI